MNYTHAAHHLIIRHAVSIRDKVICYRHREQNRQNPKMEESTDEQWIEQMNFKVYLKYMDIIIVVVL